MAKIKICPKCKESKLKTALNVSGWLAPNMYKCTNCGYMGYFYIEIDTEDLNMHKNDLKENNNK
ncbi:MAG: hypothetical protein GF317_20115 [Candidatus Lokiarchaeota archaeon]|nr:hypothetical protein [Candidatus Lokiarchaeota archaeon]MBD3201788.1 hypothetical protein [Candidatus Lokiarchaeota archaeon]